MYELKGFDEMMDQLEKRFGPEAMKRLSEEALEEGLKAFEPILEEEMKKFSSPNSSKYATGASVEEISHTTVERRGRTVRVFVYWKGSKQRYRLIHLNENGYTREGKVYKNKLKGYGAIARAMAKGESIYYQKVKEVLQGGI